MNVAMKRTMLAVAVGLICASGSVYAQHSDDGDNGRHNRSFQQSYSLEQDGTHKQKVVFDKKLKLHTDINLSGDPTVTGNINIDSAAIAIVDNRQKNHDNSAENFLLDNDASIADEVGSAASGNLGFNVASGDNNQQDNAAALAATDARFVFGMADGEVFVNQLGHDNETMNAGVTNSASVGGSAFNAASGNLAVNVTSGNNNQQKNSLAAAVATSNYATATVDSSQYSKDNATSNAGYFDVGEAVVADITLSGAVDGTYSGTSGGNAYQSNDFYPDTWTGTTHTAGNQTGHIDFDSEAQGAVANPLRPGAGGLAFDTASDEMGDIDLDATLTGQISIPQLIAVFATNDASLSGGAFQNASGNIGVNVSAGTGNQQANSLAMAVAQPGTGGGGGGE